MIAASGFLNDDVKSRLAAVNGILIRLHVLVEGICGYCFPVIAD
jgi:hypothetical protein